MASNFAFSPMGLSRQITVGGAAPTTVSFNLVQLGGVTTSIVPSSLRIAHEGTAACFIQFGPAVGVTVSVNTGMKMLANTVEVYGIRGQPFMAAVCASTFTVTLCATVGEGM